MTPKRMTLAEIEAASAEILMDEMRTRLGALPDMIEALIARLDADAADPELVGYIREFLDVTAIRLGYVCETIRDSVPRRTQDSDPNDPLGEMLERLKGFTNPEILTTAHVVREIMIARGLDAVTRSSTS